MEGHNCLRNDGKSRIKEQEVFLCARDTFYTEFHSVALTDFFYYLMF